MTLEQARERAVALTHEINDGHDPAQARLDQRRELTFGELVEL
jgi:hypothetical protein